MIIKLSYKKFLFFFIFFLKLKFPLIFIEAFFDYIKYCRTLEFEEDPDYEYILNLFKGALSLCDEEEPDFDWNKDLKMEKFETNFHYAKYINKSMIINQKSDTSCLYNKGNETAYSPNLMKSSGICKPEE